MKAKQGLAPDSERQSNRSTAADAGAQAAASANAPSVAKGAALNLVGAALFGLSGFVFAFILSNQLGPGGAGRFWIGLAVFNITSRISELGTASGLVHGVARARADGRAHQLSTVLSVAIRPVLLASVIGVAAVVGLAFTAFAVDGQPDQVLLAFAPFVIAAAIYTPIVQGLRGFGSMTSNVVIDRVVRGLLLPASALITLELTGSIAMAALAWGTSTLLLAVVAARVFKRSITAYLNNPNRVRVDRRSTDERDPEIDRSEVRDEFWTFTKPRIGGQILDVMVLWIDVLLVGVLASPTAAGIYGAVSRFAIVGMFVAEALMKVVGPRTAELVARENYSGISNLRHDSALAHTIIVWPVYLVVIAFAPLLASLFGPEFAEGASALRILAMGLMVSSLFGPVGSILLMSGDSKATLRVGALGFATNLILNLILIPMIGIEGAAVAWAATFIVRAIANSAACRTAGIDVDISSVASVAVALTLFTVLTSVGSKALFGTDVAGMLAAGSAGAIAIVAFMFVMRPLAKPRT